MIDIDFRPTLHSNWWFPIWMKYSRSERKAIDNQSINHLRSLSVFWFFNCSRYFKTQITCFGFQRQHLWQIVYRQWFVRNFLTSELVNQTDQCLRTNGWETLNVLMLFIFRELLKEMLKCNSQSSVYKDIKTPQRQCTVYV